jgi:hypothetical protein
MRFYVYVFYVPVLLDRGFDLKMSPCLAHERKCVDFNASAVKRLKKKRQIINPISSPYQVVRKSCSFESNVIAKANMRTGYYVLK